LSVIRFLRSAATRSIVAAVTREDVTDTSRSCEDVKTELP
jgi:hypothetical protein